MRLAPLLEMQGKVSWDHGCQTALNWSSNGSVSRLMGIMSEVPRKHHNGYSLLKCWLSDILQKKKGEEGARAEGKADRKAWNNKWDNEFRRNGIILMWSNNSYRLFDQSQPNWKAFLLISSKLFFWADGFSSYTAWIACLFMFVLSPLIWMYETPISYTLPFRWIISLWTLENLWGFTALCIRPYKLGIIGNSWTAFPSAKEKSTF